MADSRRDSSFPCAYMDHVSEHIHTHYLAQHGHHIKYQHQCTLRSQTNTFPYPHKTCLIILPRWIKQTWTWAIQFTKNSNQSHTLTTHSNSSIVHKYAITHVWGHHTVSLHGRFDSCLIELISHRLIGMRISIVVHVSCLMGRNEGGQTTPRLLSFSSLSRIFWSAEKRFGTMKTNAPMHGPNDRPKQICTRPRRDSNSQSSDPKSDALSIRPRGPHNQPRKIYNQIHKYN